MRVAPRACLLALLLWPSWAAADNAPACPYGFSHKKVDGKHVPLDGRQPLSPKQCALMQSLEDPLRRIVAAASLDGPITLHPNVMVENGHANMYFSSEGLFATDGFLTCFENDHQAAIQLLCHEVGHAVQWRGPDATVRAAMKTQDKLPQEQAAALNRDYESQADLIGREICTRAGFAPNAEAYAKAFARCNGLSQAHPMSTHPSTDQRIEEAEADRARLRKEQYQLAMKAVQARARRVLTHTATPEDLDAFDPRRTPLDWALSPAADRQRLREPYTPSKTFAELRAASATRTPEKITPPPAPLRITVNAQRPVAVKDWPCAPAPQGEPGWSDYAGCYSMVGLSKVFDWGRSLSK